MKINKINISRACHLLKSQTPLAVYLKLIKFVLFKKRMSGYMDKKIAFENSLANKKFSVDWFIGNIPIWHDVFCEAGIEQNKKYNILEIGSFEGLSSLFLLQTFPYSMVTCVDTWAGADEHSTLDMRKIEDNFDFNTSPYKDRLIKYKGTSFSFFEKRDVYNETYDIIYVDGSHYVDDVMVDGLRCFSMLKNGGLIIFDDYMWDGYRQMSANPAAAINALIKMKSNFLKVKAAYRQLILLKIASESHDASQVSL